MCKVCVIVENGAVQEIYSSMDNYSDIDVIDLDAEDEIEKAEMEKLAEEVRDNSDLICVY